MSVVASAKGKGGKGGGKKGKGGGGDDDEAPAKGKKGGKGGDDAGGDLEQIEKQIKSDMVRTPKGKQYMQRNTCTPASMRKLAPQAHTCHDGVKQTNPRCLRGIADNHAQNAPQRAGTKRFSAHLSDAHPLAYALQEERTKKSLTALADNMNTIRTGRASASIVDRIMVDYAGTPTPLKSMAQVWGTPIGCAGYFRVASHMQTVSRAACTWVRSYTHNEHMQSFHAHFTRPEPASKNHNNGQVYGFRVEIY